MDSSEPGPGDTSPAGQAGPRRTLLLPGRAPLNIVYITVGIGLVALLASVAEGAPAAWVILASILGLIVGLLVGLGQARRVDRPFQAAIETAPEAMLLIDRGTVSIANSAALALVKKSRDQVIGRELDGLFADRVLSFPSGEQVSWDSTIRDAIAELPIVISAKDDSALERWYEVVAAERPNAPSDQILVTMRDITTRHRLDEVRGEMLALTSHDLRAPLTVIAGYLDILRRPLDEDQRQRAIDAARLSVDRMIQMLDDLIDVSEAEGLFVPKRSLPVSLADMAEDVAASFREIETSHKLRVVAEDRPVVLGEDLRLRQALVNLITNAFKYSPEGTTVTVRVSSDERSAFLSVEDEGPGIPAASRIQVFQRLCRLGNGSSDVPGLGLGLYIVRLTAESHGGSARAEEAPGGGARLVVELPLTEEKRPTG